MLMFRQQMGLIVCFIECLLFGGTLYGWPSLVYVLKDDGVYAHLCRDSKTATTATLQQLLQQPPQTLLNLTGSVAKGTAYTTIRGAGGVMVNGSSPSPGAGNVTGAALNTTKQGRPLSDVHKEILTHIHDLACIGQETHLALAVILAVLTQGLSALPVGRLFDKFGLRVTRSLACVFGFVGYNVLAFVQDGVTSWLVYPGCICIGIAQNTIMMTNCYVTELAGSRASSLVALYNGAMLASSGVLLMVKLAHDHGVHRTTSVAVLGGLWIIAIVNTFTFLPKRKLLKPSPSSLQTPSASSPDTELSSTPYITATDDNQDGDTQVANDHSNMSDVSSNYVPAYELSWTRGLLASEPSESEFEMTDMQSAQQSNGGLSLDRKNRGDDGMRWGMHIRSSLFISYLYWFCALHFRINVFISTFSIWVRMVGQDDRSRESYYTDIYGYLNVAGIVLSPLPGLLIDYRRRKLARNERFGLLGAMATTPALTFSTAVAVVMGLTSLLKYESAIYISIVMCVVLRTCVYPTGTAFIGLVMCVVHICAGTDTFLYELCNVVLAMNMTLVVEMALNIYYSLTHSAFIGLVWPTRVYGTLFGMTFTMLGAVAFLQYPFVIWASTLHRGNVSMNALLLFLTLLSFVLPGHVLFKYRKRKECHGATAVPTTVEG